MSRGIGAHANLMLQDENTVVYEYGGYNLNDEQFRNENVPELPPEMMSVNIFHNRECLASDFMILEKVVDYMINVTNKIKINGETCN